MIGDADEILPPRQRRRCCLEIHERLDDGIKEGTAARPLSCYTRCIICYVELTTALMRLANTTSAALLSSLFVRPKLPICPINQSSLYHSMPAPVISVCHGGGPMPVLGDPGHAPLIKSLSERVPKILGLGTPSAPRAIVLVTAHWGERQPTISNANKHELLYDYGGFPPEAYKLKYDAPGSPEVAGEVFEALKKAGLDPVVNSRRGMPTSYLP